MSVIPSRLAEALADRYRIERAATYLAARPTIALRFSWSRTFAERCLPGTGDSPQKSLRDGVPSSDVSRGKPR